VPEVAAPGGLVVLTAGFGFTVIVIIPVFDVSLIEVAVIVTGVWVVTEAGAT
jgi:hypothetical protein